MKPALRVNSERASSESDGGGDIENDLEWEKGEDGAVLRDKTRGNLDRKKKKRKSGDGSGGGLESGKKTKTKKTKRAHKVVEF